MWITAFGGLGGIAYGVRELPTLAGWIWLVLGIDLLVVTLGLWYAKEWARIACCAIVWLHALAALWGVGRHAVERKWLESVFGLVWVALYGVLAWYLMQRSTREQFAVARAAIRRARESRA